MEQYRPETNYPTIYQQENYEAAQWRRYPRPFPPPFFPPFYPPVVVIPFPPFPRPFPPIIFR